MPKNPSQLLIDGAFEQAEIEGLLTSVGFSDWQTAFARLKAIGNNDDQRTLLSQSLPILLSALSGAATPDTSLLNLERLHQTVPSQIAFLKYLADHPRAVEILVKLFVGSQFLTEILLRNPGYLHELTHHKRVAEFKSRQDFRASAEEAMSQHAGTVHKLDALRRFQHWELLRIGACDSFGLMDLRSITVQLSLLADAVVQSALAVHAAELGLDTNEFCVLAMGKLGGEELNYSSDIDLVFVCSNNASRFWELGQRLIRSLMDTTGEGFLYRVDMRLRPWGNSGALVTSESDYLDYLSHSAALWEKQALIKARPIAGALAFGSQFIKRVLQIAFESPAEDIRKNVMDMKSQIESKLSKQLRTFGDVKSGQGSIRDIEFVTQFLQLKFGRSTKHLRSINTLDGLVRLSDGDCILPPEFRQLSTAYVFLRKIEHSLQLMHYKQVHALPTDEREMLFLARRLDFPDTKSFVTSYQQHCNQVRAIYEKYIENAESLVPEKHKSDNVTARHASVMTPSYRKVFNKQQILKHAELLAELSDDRPVVIHQRVRSAGGIELTVCGFDQRGDLALMCGLLFVYGFDIVNGNIFTADDVVDVQVSSNFKRPMFVNVFALRPPLELMLPEVWNRFQDDLTELLNHVAKGQLQEAQGRLAKRVAHALREVASVSTTLLPIDILIDNNLSDHHTALHISAEDTPGFLYELTNALALAGYDIHRVMLTSIGNRVMDRLLIASPQGGKIIDQIEQSRLKATVVLVKHFTHLLPNSPNPEKALKHFRQFFEQILEQEDWVDELGTLIQSEVLEALARLLGVSDFLWEDFLRLQHDNLFPVVTDVEGLGTRKNRDELNAELQTLLFPCQTFEEQADQLNGFKDREMFRVDMRHIVGRIPEFGTFSNELTEVAEVVTAAAFTLCNEKLEQRYGRPQTSDGQDIPMCVVGLGKAGGRELGFASDIELMFVYDGIGQTSAARKISESEFFVKLVESFTNTIQAKRKGIFELDLRLRPYGNAGPMAVSLAAFDEYFCRSGAAWPYERQSLVKLRTLAGDCSLGQRVEELRDSIVFSGEGFDVAAMRAMRERQLHQLVVDGKFNAKLSAGGLVDCEYLVQGLQITYGHRAQELRSTNTCDALDALLEHKLVSADDHQTLRNAYVFLRRMIDALRMVRGDARDLTIPDTASEEFEFLAGRLGYGLNTQQLASEVEQTAANVCEASRLLDDLNE
jgi:[glutamine synthetase] adenylyltransferase / [glutamine synthetase]-adenylyl-L-tyrosine phosphorylase